MTTGPPCDAPLQPSVLHASQDTFTSLSDFVMALTLDTKLFLPAPLQIEYIAASLVAHVRWIKSPTDSFEEKF